MKNMSIQARLQQRIAFRKQAIQEATFHKTVAKIRKNFTDVEVFTQKLRVLENSQKLDKNILADIYWR